MQSTALTTIGEEENEVIKNLTPFHKRIARLVAEGKKMKEICRDVHITASRLSVLKTSPLMKRAIAYYEGVVEKGFQKARRVLDKGAVKAANVIVDSLDSAVMTQKDKASVGFGLLDRLGIKQVQKKSTVGDGEMLFEQTLRVVKREGLPKSDEPSEFDKLVDEAVDV